MGRKLLDCDFRVPALKVTHDEETNEVSVDVCDDPYQFCTLDVSNLPLLITVGQVSDTSSTKYFAEINALFVVSFRLVEFIPLIQLSKKILLL